MSEIKKLSTENYEETIASGVVVVDFYADWCMPCKNMGPIFEGLAVEYGAKATFAKLNTDESQQIAIANKVMTIPTFIIFKDGVPIDRVSGVVGKQALVDKIEAAL